MLIIGSVALKEGLKKYGLDLGRDPKDIDYICSFSEMENFCEEYGLTYSKLSNYKYKTKLTNGTNVEFEISDYSKSGQMYIDYVHTYTEYKPDISDNCTFIHAPLEVLLSIKRSHRHYPIQFDKHIRDYSLIKTVMPVDILSNITKIREQETAERYGKLKTPSLNKSSKDFFTDNVSNRVFIHDDIHRIMAYYDTPMYEYYSVGDGTVKCSKEKFYRLHCIDQIKGVLEEAYVIALERILIPMIYSGGPLSNTDTAFKWALMRICTTLTSGWFRDFATENYKQIYDYYDRKFPEKFFDAVDAGEIKRI
jgi:hypothetical protein